MKRTDWAIPISFGGGAWLCSWLYDIAPRPIAEAALPVFALALVFGPSILYPLMRRRGARASQAAAASLFLPATWLAVECYEVARVFSAAEGLYYALNPLMLGFATLLALQLSIAEVAVRTLRRQARTWRGWPTSTLAVIVVFWGAVFLATRGKDVTAIHYAYIDIYRHLVAP